MVDDRRFSSEDYSKLLSMAREQIHHDGDLIEALGRAGKESGVDLPTLSMILNLPEHDVERLAIDGMDCSIGLIEKYASAIGAKIEYTLSNDEGVVLIDDTDDFNKVVAKVEDELNATSVDDEEHAYRMGIVIAALRDMVKEPKSMTVSMVRRYVNSARMLITYKVIK